VDQLSARHASLVTRLRIFSDLHTELWPFEPPRVQCDVVILAGDIGVKTRGVEWALQTFSDVPVIYVPGNHEYYGGAVPHLTDKMRALTNATNVTVLDEDEVIVDGVRFLGATLWTDFALFGVDRRDEAMDAAQTHMTDYARIRKSPRFSKLRPVDTLALHRRAKAWLRDALARPYRGPTVVVTHHAPEVSSIADRHRTDLLSAAYATNLRELLDGRAAMWIHGHTHTAVDRVVNGTRIVANQRGYPDEPAENFRDDLVVDV
jgi:3',5'-cyclic AMP phosphodiesterase CpdA